MIIPRKTIVQHDRLMYGHYTAVNGVFKTTRYLFSGSRRSATLADQRSVKFLPVSIIKWLHWALQRTREPQDYTWSELHFISGLGVSILGTGRDLSRHPQFGMN